MEAVTLVKDFAVIMLAAGVISLLFIKIRQPPVVGYLLAGILIGPYALPSPPVTDLHTISLLADLGLILLLFGLGLEFSWSKIRTIGMTVLLIGSVEIVAMMCLGYGIGLALGWSAMDSVFLGAALHISSSAIIVKVLRDSGKLEQESSKLVVGILVVEDFAAVVILTFLSGLATTGAAGIGDIGSLVLRLVVFVAVSLTLGAVIVPTLIRWAHRSGSSEALLLFTLGLCFGMALLGKYLGLSVAAGAFLVGALIGDTEHAEDVTHLVRPIRDMFLALFFVTIGMLVDITRIREFIVPAVVVASVFVLGKMLGNTLATFSAGYSPRTALNVGAGESVMGEFSLAIAKVGADRGVVSAPLYPVITLVTALTSVTGPYLIRSADAIAGLVDRTSPVRLKDYADRVADWLQAIRATFSREGQVAERVKRSVRVIIVNLLIIVVIMVAGTLILDFVLGISFLEDVRDDVVGVLLGLIVLALCTPSFVVIWLNLQTVVDEAASHLLRRRKSARWWNRETVRAVLRDSVLVVMTVFVAIWFVPFIAGLFSIGSYAVILPAAILVLALYFVVSSIRRIHRQVERAFGRELLGTETETDATSVERVHGHRLKLISALFAPLRRLAQTLRRNDRRSTTVEGETRDPEGDT